MPKVSILVPAIRPEFLDLCIASALCQTFQDFELLISDDRDDNAVESVVSKWTDRRIRYMKNPNKRLPGGNRDHLLSQAAGKYIKFLFDDDFLLPQSIEFLVAVAEKFGGKLIFHGRYLVDSAGRIMAAPLYQEQGMVAPISREMFFNGMVGRSFNFIGEPSNVLFEAEALCDMGSPFGLDGMRMRFLTDVAFYMNFARRDLKIMGFGFLGSAFRRHHDQTSGADQPVYSAGLFEWELFQRWAIDHGEMDFQTYQQAIANLHTAYRGYMDSFPELGDFLKLEGGGDGEKFLTNGFLETLAGAYERIEERVASLASLG